MDVSTRAKYLVHAIKRRDDYPKGSTERHRWKVIAIALCFNASIRKISTMLKRF